MAKFSKALPVELQNELKKLEKECENIFGEMTKAGAEVVLSNVKNNIPEGLKELTSENIKITKTYKTPTDDGINTKVIITGYFTNKNGKKVPAPLVANMFEYGSNARTGKYERKNTKHPFFRKSFKKAQITKAMEEVQKKYIKE